MENDTNPSSYPTVHVSETGCDINRFAESTVAYRLFALVFDIVFNL
jgi:hypothetical protein